MKTLTLLLSLLCTGALQGALILSDGTLAPEATLTLDTTPASATFTLTADGSPTARLALILDGKPQILPLGQKPLRTSTLPTAWALELTWRNPDGSIRQTETYHTQTPFENPALWLPLDPSTSDAQLALPLLPIKQPLDGILTAVIDDDSGHRVRNLVSGLAYPAGRHQLEWDGYDDFGNLVPPGKYRLRTLSHPGLVPRFQYQFANGDETFFTPFGPNHGTLTALATAPGAVYAAASITEGGWAIMRLNPDGSFVRGYHQVGGCGIEEVHIATDSKRLYVFNDGVSWSSKGKIPPAITLSVYDADTGAILTGKGRRGQVIQLRVRDNVNPSRTIPKSDRTYALKGAAFCNGSLYYSDAEENRVQRVDTETFAIADGTQVEDPGVMTVHKGVLHVFSGNTLLALPSKQKLFTLDFVPRGITSDGTNFYITGAPDSTVRVVAPNGRAVKTLGTPGGDYTGKWNPERLVNPVGLAIASDGALWITERRGNPKRVSKWTTDGKCLYSKVGCAPYGSPEAGFDPENPTRWFGQHCLWDVDPVKKTSTIVSVLQKDGGHLNGKISECLHYRFVHKDGRTFILGMRKATLISELLPDGTLKDLAIISEPHNLAYALRWKLNPAFDNALKKLFPKADLADKYGKDTRGVGLLWIDTNGDGDFNEDEFQFLPPGTALGDFAWGLDMTSLTIRLPYRDAEKKEHILTLEPDGYNSVGAPNYSFEKALAHLKKADPPPPGIRSILMGPSNDLDGNTILNADPWMMSYSPEGRLNWFFPNKWVNVHGSHNAPLPKPGEMQGNIFCLGTAPLDDKSGVMLFMGNHGRVFALTTDGLYLDEMFQDCRVAEVNGAGLIGGEAFGGFFGKDEVNNRWIYQGGCSGYRIYFIEGLDKITRSSGSFTVTQKMLAEAEARKALAVKRDKNTTLAARFVRIPDGSRTPFKDIGALAEWELPGNQTARVRGGYDSKNLYLEYAVPDSSPWVNTGKNWAQMFKTGDCADIQLATDPAANPKRRDPVPGDIRLLFAPFDGKSIAVLYRHRLADKTGAVGMDFNSPWRSEHVDDVRRLDSVQVKPQLYDGAYRLEVTIPLADLGFKPAPTKGDFGVIFGDRDGTVNLSRMYWSNKNTGLVNDVPGETMLAPDLWSPVTFGE